MKPLRVVIAHHPVTAYFILTFGISWGGLLMVIGPAGSGVTREQFETLLPFAVMAMIAGPSVAGILLTALVDGRCGLREYRARLFKWQVGSRWYATALLLAPTVMLTLLLPLSRLSSQFRPAIFASHDRSTLLLFGIAVALGAGIFEELGWTGFAIPALRRRYGVLATGLIVGSVWSAWHVLAAAWGSRTVSGALSVASYLIDPFLFLVAFRVLMVWVYDHTESLLVGILMHVSLTASAMVIGAEGLTGLPLLTFDFVWFVSICVMVLLARSASASHVRREA